MAIADIRREYTLSNLRRADLDSDPIAQFRRWFDEANRKGGGGVRRLFIGLYKRFLLLVKGETIDVNAAALATADQQGRASVRFVLLKGVDERGFIFYTNYDSRKGQELAENPHAALVFYWSELGRQVSIAGTVSKLSREESEAYHRSRPVGSRIAAWASRQSEVVKDRATLEQRWNEFRAKYPNNDVPLPPFWGGYVLAPSRIEFWQGCVSRLHDRFCYTKQPDGTWRVDRLYP